MTAPLRPLAALLVQSVGPSTPDPGTYALGPELTSLPSEVVLAAASLHRVTPAVALRVAGATDAPAEWLPPLSAARHAQLMRLLRARTELQVVGRALDGAGIGWVAIKGPVAADVLWPRPDLREFFDLDLLIDPARFDEAVEVLHDAGARDVDRNWPLLEQTMRAELAMLAPWGSPLDVHWDIAVTPRQRRAFRPDIPAMLARRVQVTLGDGATVWTLDPIDTLLHLAFHAAQAGMNRLMWSADLAHASRRLTDEDWPELVRRAEQARIEVPVALVLRRASSLFPAVATVDGRAIAPAHRTWGKVIAARDEVVPFPGLPGDHHLGGTLYGAARRSLVHSTVGVVLDRIKLWHLQRRDEHQETESQALSRDVADQGARSRYLDNVRAWSQR